MPLFRALMFCSLWIGARAFAAEVFVDNQIGNEGNDGSSPFFVEAGTGPVRTLGRAADIARFGDLIVLANTGQPYYESLSLTGSRHSGSPLRPFVIVGNGATLSGLRCVSPDGWEKQRDKIWKLTSTRKGYYQLLRNGKLLKELIREPGTDPLELLEPGQWVSWHGSLYFRQDGIDPPTEQAFTFTADQTGISMHAIRNVLITDLVLEHFRFDGLHAQGLCDNIELNNVTSIENGRAGVVASGKSSISLFDCKVARNGRQQVLTFDRSTAVEFSSVSKE